MVVEVGIKVYIEHTDREVYYSDVSFRRTQNQREQVGETEGAPTPDNQEAEAQVVQDVEVVPSPQLQAPVEVQALRYQVAQASPSSIPTKQFSTRSTRGVAPRRVTYQVRGQPTVYYLAKSMHKILVEHIAYIDQREHQQSEFLPMTCSSDETM